MSFIVAVDPGEMTGWARSHEGSFASGEAPLSQVLHTIHETIRQGFKVVIICEDFIITPETLKKTRQDSALNGRGALWFMAEEYGSEFILQTAASAKSFSTDDKLKRVGWHTPGKPHANDAARHLLVHAAGNGLIRVDQFLKENDADD